MDDRDRAAIEELFDKLARVEQQAGPRDREAEAFIRSQMAQQPAAAYLMAQTIIVQEQALNEAHRRLQEMESQTAQRSSGGGFLDSIFGGGTQRQVPGQAPARRTAAPTGQQRYSDEGGGPWASRRGYGVGMGGGGFLAGAAQTAMGVAGGVVLGNMIADMLTPDQAAAAGLGDTAGADDAGAQDAGFDDGADANETEVADAGDDFGGGDFDMGDV